MNETTTAPTIIGFTILEKIGEGGMASVWKARQKSLDRTVAVKVLSDRMSRDVADVEMFKAEARATAKLRHPCIVQVYDAGTSEEGLCYFVMEFVGGYTVGDWLRRKGILTETDTLMVAEYVSDALGHAWDTLKMTHCDIKPDNVMVDTDGTIRVTDLGLSRSMTAVQLRDSEHVMGTPAYIAPEQATGEPDIDFRADIYALGAMMYHMVAGHLLFEGEPGSGMMERQVTDFAEDVIDVCDKVSEPMAWLLEKMLAKDRADRHESWADVKRDIQRVQKGHMPAAKPLPSGRSTMKRSRQRVLTTGSAMGARRSTERDEPGDGRRRVVLARTANVAPVLDAGGERRTGDEPGQKRQRMVLARSGKIAAGSKTDTGGDPGRQRLGRTRGVVRLPRERGQGNGGMRTFLLLGGLMVFVVLLAVGRGGRPGVGQTTPARPTHVAGPSPQEQAQAMFEEAKAWADEHPDDVDGIVRRYQQVQREHEGSSYSRMAATEVSRLRRVREDGVAKVMSRLAEQAEEPLRRGAIDEVIALYSGYQGDLAKETLDARRERINACRADAQRAVAEADAAKQKRALEQSGLLERVVGILVKDGAAAAGAAMKTELTTHPALAGDESLQASLAVLKDAASLDDRILNSFRQQTGQEVELRLVRGLRKALIVGIKGDEIVLRSRFEGVSSSVNESAKVADLAVRERLDRMGDDSDPAAALGKGLMAVQSKRFDHARRFFGNVGGALGPRLMAWLDTQDGGDTPPPPARADAVRAPTGTGGADEEAGPESDEAVTDGAAAEEPAKTKRGKAERPGTLVPEAPADDSGDAGDSGEEPAGDGDQDAAGGDEFDF